MAEHTDIIKMKIPVSIFNGHKLEAIQYRVEYSVNVHKGLEGYKKCLRSPVFHLGNDDEYQARIICYFKGGCDYNKGCNGSGCCFVQFLSENDSKPNKRKIISLSYMKRSVVGNETRSMFSGKPVRFYEDSNPTWGTCCHPPFRSHSRFYNNRPRHDPSSWLYGDTLTIVCDITLPVTLSTAQVDVENKLKIPVIADIPQKQLLEDIRSLLGKTELSNVNISVGGKTLQAHEVILSARSPVFAKMFQTEMLETKLRVVEITDMEYEVVQSMLVYMYTDCVPGLDVHAEVLMSAADKYQLDGLKDKCEEALVKGLRVENAARRFVLADLHRAKTLKAKAVDFIRKKRRRVEETEDWQVAKRTRLLEMAALFM